ncbi:MAG: YdiU family protein [Chitinophagales bacterium]|nr:YdiU family protein [Chitinophagales bacterium]
MVFRNSFVEELAGDEELKNYPRQVYNACYSRVDTRISSHPSLLIYSKDLAKELAIANPESKTFLDIFSGNAKAKNSFPYAMCYGGHQFGHWAGQLGDGRAINLGELISNNKAYSLQLKGAGSTPYSRSADGLAVLRSSLREFLCSEAMHYLGVPTTRALSLAITGDQVLRDMLYDGNPAHEAGAVVCRVAPSFIRFGNFEILSARKDYSNLKSLCDYTIKHFFPELGEASKKTYLAFFEEVAKRTADMIVHWQRVGFVHGVMNTDNMSILGLSIDYGPYGWLEDFDLEWTPNTTDREHKRYRFGNQGEIALWNLIQLANALYPLIEDVAALEAILDRYRSNYVQDYYKMQLAKLGIYNLKASDQAWIEALFSLMKKAELDMTIFYRNLANFDENTPKEHLVEVQKASYLNAPDLKALEGEILEWLESYATRLKEENTKKEERRKKMHLLNPKYVLRNYMAQMAIDEVEKGSKDLLLELYQLLQHPYDEQEEMEKWFALRPEWAKTKIGCSQLSCSS